MADRFVHGNEPLDSTSDDSRSSVVQNDQIITEDDQASSCQENIAHECSSTNTNQNVFDREAVENSVTLADYHVEHQKPTFENRHQIGGGTVDLRQNVVDNRISDTGTSCDNVVDRTKRTVEDHQSASGMVDRRQSTVEYTDMDHMVNCQDKKNSTHCPRNKATVEDTNEKSTEQQCPSVSQVVDSTLTNHVGDHEKSAFQDSQSMKTGNLVDRQKRTVEDDTPTTKATEEELWKIQLHVDTECSQDIINELPTSKCFEWNKSVLFGRGDVVDIFVNHDQASRNHVELIGQTLPNGQVLFMTRNISTSKGYNLNGQYITDNNQWIPLNKGDQIKIAGLTFTVDIIPAAAIMRIFVIEFILPQVHHSPVVTIPSPVVTNPSPVVTIPSSVAYRAPYLSNGQSSFYYPVPSVQPFANPHGNFVAPPSAHGNYVHPAYLPPNNGMPIQPYWLYGGMQPGQPYLAGNPTNITGDMVEHALQPYQEREGYVNIRTLRYLAREAVGVWEQLGRALGLKDWQLTMIDMDYSGIGKKSYQMLITWVWCNPEQATLENLKTALEDMLVGRGDLAVKYCTSVQNNDTNVQNNGEENANVPDSTNDGESHSG